MIELIGLIFIPIFFICWISIVVFIFRGIITTISNERRIATRNRASPLLSREAQIVGKRQNVRGGSETSTTTSYYLTFEFTDGSRKEFGVTGEEYGLLAEGDRGMLQSQGTWYKGFNRL
jgi:hypothetical protein